MRLITSGIIFVSALLLVGCQNREAALVGKWKGEIKGKDEIAKKDPTAGAMLNLLGNTSLELKQDKTYTMTVMVAIEGTWKFTGDTLSLTPLKIAGQSIAAVQAQIKQMGMSSEITAKVGKPAEFTISSDNKSLTQIGGAKGQGFSFTKEEGAADKGDGALDKSK